MSRLSRGEKFLGAEVDRGEAHDGAFVDVPLPVVAQLAFQILQRRHWLERAEERIEGRVTAPVQPVGARMDELEEATGVEIADARNPRLVPRSDLEHVSLVRPHGTLVPVADAHVSHVHPEHEAELGSLLGVVAPLWLRANAPMVVAEVCSTMKYPKRSQYKHAKQKKYHVRNWAEYNEGLRRRGDLTVWFDEEAIANWMADKTGKPGGQRVYSDLAIETSLVVRMVYKLAYRQTEGFLHSIASLLGLGIEIPDYSTLCRRSRLLRKKLRIPKAASSQPIHLMIDSTGLRIHVGTARKPPKQRAWRKLHIAVDRKTGNIVASELTASRARDATRVPALLTQIQAPLVSVAADSAYDKEAVYETIEAHSPGRRTRVVIPPQRNATLSQNSNTAMQERDRHIRAIERHGRREWYKLSGCTKRSMVENAVYRYKAIIGPEMRTRTLARQRVEHRIGCEILNKMTALGMPDTYCAG